MKVDALRPRRVIGVGEGESLRGAARLFMDDEIGALLIYSSTGAIGVFTERDLSRAVADGCDLDETQVEDYMTDTIASVPKNASVEDVVATMNEFAIRHVVVEGDEGPETVVSVRDVVRLVGEQSAAV